MQIIIRKFIVNVLFALAMVMLFIQSGRAQDPGGVTIIDARHYSIVLGETRNYRIFLPPGYSDHLEKRYPVIYFFHGWSQRYFGASDPYSDYDKGDENGGDNIANFVSQHDVIIVKVDGYNRSPDEKYYVRPWNVTPVETYRQFPLYFPELVEHIDSHYRTIADREHRGISGLSMGGFMTFWIGGKYPHLLSAAGNFCGSPEFTVGPKDFPVEYRHLDMYNNYAGMNLRLNYGDKDFIRGYHEDMNRMWPQIIDNYEYKVYDAAHSTCGMGEMFTFILKTFENPAARPSPWDHIDVYPEFSLWNYRVMTDRAAPGFTILENVDARGFRCSVREFLPDGALLSFVKVSVRTPPIYEKNHLYTINDVDTRTSKAIQRTIRSDDQGRLMIDINGSTHEIGINKTGDKPNVSLVALDLQGARWATNGKEVMLTIKILNKGASVAKNIRATLTATRPGAQVIKGEVSFGDIAVNEMKTGNSATTFRVSADSIEIQKFKLTFRDDRKNQWVDYFEIPLKRDLPQINDFEIADGRIFTVAKAGIDTATIQLGKGNGDGVANPGESIVILVKDQNKLWRTDLSGSDPNINPF
ncbi:MAG: alpha/beta hydrolase-fold protein, partial [Cyclobacteriaceae bacterium]